MTWKYYDELEEVYEAGENLYKKCSAKNRDNDYKNNNEIMTGHMPMFDEGSTEDDVKVEKEDACKKGFKLWYPNLRKVIESHKDYDFLSEFPEDILMTSYDHSEVVLEKFLSKIKNKLVKLSKAKDKLAPHSFNTDVDKLHFDGIDIKYSGDRARYLEILFKKEHFSRGLFVDEVHPYIDKAAGRIDDRTKRKYYDMRRNINKKFKNHTKISEELVIGRLEPISEHHQVNPRLT